MRHWLHDFTSSEVLGEEVLHEQKGGTGGDWWVQIGGCTQRVQMAQLCLDKAIKRPWLEKQAI